MPTKPSIVYRIPACRTDRFNGGGMGDTIITSKPERPSYPGTPPNTDEAGSLVERARGHFVVSLKATEYLLKAGSFGGRAFVKKQNLYFD
jgi:hypothetical protein